MDTEHLPEPNPKANCTLKPLSLTRREALLAALGVGLAAPHLAQAMPSKMQQHAEAALHPEAAPQSRAVYKQLKGGPARPWAKAAAAWYPPGVPGRDYNPVFVPNGSTLPYRIGEGGVKIFHLTAEEIIQELAPGLYANVWGYNGQVPGPLIEVLQGDRVRIYVTNNLPVRTTIHWHGMLLPCGMDGVSALTQPVIMPGETGIYEYLFPDAGNFMYHPHFDGMTQEGMGLTGMMVVHPRGGPRPDRDFALLLHEWFMDLGVSRPNPFVANDFNLLTINGVAFPNTYPLVAGLGERVKIRIGNLSPMDHHPIHLHGYKFWVTETDAGPIPESARWPEVTVLVPVGSMRAIEFYTDNPGDWLMHCHMTHHTMNQMGHDIPNMVGVEVPRDLEETLKKIVPGYMTMGQKGMEGMADMNMPVPENSAPMVGFSGQFGETVLGGMVTVLKVREHTDGYRDPGPYEFPDGTVMAIATEEDLRRDRIEVPPKERKMHRPGEWRPA
jgi:FtsP/CotA-like multicopper oxidase with cupredoxin domain